MEGRSCARAVRCDTGNSYDHIPHMGISLGGIGLHGANGGMRRGGVCDQGDAKVTIQELMRCATCVGTVHESCFRAYHTLRFVEHLLERGTPSDVVLELLRDINTFPPINTDSGVRLPDAKDLPV